MEFGRFWGGPDLFMRLFVNKTMVLVDQFINHIHVPPRFDFFGFHVLDFTCTILTSWWKGIRTDRMSIHHCSGVTSISTGIYRAEFWVGVCWTPDSGNSWTKDEIRCYRIIAWTKTVSSHQAVDFVQLALLYSAWGLRQSCGTLVRRSGLSFDGK